MNETVGSLNCPHCGVVFITHRPNQRFCTPEHRIIYNAARFETVEKDRWLTVKEAAVVLGVSDRTVRRWLLEGDGYNPPMHWIFRRGYLVDKRSVVKLKENRADRELKA